jgi:hypothetical protein
MTEHRAENADEREREERRRQAMREDEDLRRTGIIQSERQVLELAREYFGLEKRGGAA